VKAVVAVVEAIVARPRGRARIETCAGLSSGMVAAVARPRGRARIETATDPAAGAN